VKHRIDPVDFLLAFAAIVTGMALMFVLLSSSSISNKLLVGLLGLGLALTCLSLWRAAGKVKKREREVMVCKETVLVDVDGSAELIFGPSSPMEDPVLYITAHGRPISVEDVWHDGVSTVAVPRSVLYWNKGVSYPGTVSADRQLRILVRNQGYAAAAVRASLSSRKPFCNADPKEK
jgi:hypothetical protein